MASTADRPNTDNRRQWLWIGAGLATAAAGAFALYRLGNGGERPDYQVERQDGAFTVRVYPALTVAETRSIGVRRAALNAGFSRLADYIFAKDRPGERVAMTAPVLSDTTDGAWRTRFILPAHYTEQTAPAPQAGVTVTTLAGRRVAAVQFSGNADDALLADREAALVEWMARHDLKATGPAEYAFYNAPFVPGPMRRNEVMFPLAD
ncbi:SOUL family heme-binding protein [Sphingomonas sp. CJ99]